LQKKFLTPPGYSVQREPQKFNNGGSHHDRVCETPNPRIADAAAGLVMGLW
jgi:hypothetical protein